MLLKCLTYKHKFNMSIDKFVPMPYVSTAGETDVERAVKDSMICLFRTLRENYQGKAVHPGYFIDKVSKLIENNHEDGLNQVKIIGL